MFGWIDTKVYDQTKDEQKAGGWCGQVLDTNGDGRITRPWNVLDGRGDSALYAGDTTGGAGGRGGRGAPVPLDAKLDTMVNYSLYSVIPSPVDDTVWGVSERYPGYLVRLQRGNNPPSSCKTQLFKVPEPGFDPRGVDIDSNGVVWTALAASSHLASFDVRKCKDLNGPAKTDGSQCREGWTLYQTTGPKFKGTDVPADFHYYNWVDQHNISGLGANTPFATGSNSDSLLALNPQTRQWTTLRVPVPARVLFARHGRPHRRSGRRMEGAGALRELRHALRLAHRGRQRHQGQDRQVPDSTGSVGEITTGNYGPAGAGHCGRRKIIVRSVRLQADRRPERGTRLARRSHAHVQTRSSESLRLLGLHRYFLTFCTFQRQPRFTTSDAVDLVLLQIQRAARENSFALIAYCFMPDHVHLLVQAQADDSDARRFIKALKQSSASISNNVLASNCGSGMDSSERCAMTKRR